MATVNFGWTLPTPGGSLGTWDEILNAAFDAVDADLQTVKETADAALPAAGGAMTGNLHMLTETGTVVVNTTATGAVTLDLATANVFALTLTGNITSLTLNNVPASPKLVVLILEINTSSNRTIAWPASFKFPDGAAPSLSPSGRDIWGFYTRDGGTTWNFVGAQQGLA